MPKFTRISATGVLCQKNWFQAVDVFTITYPYTFKVSGVGIIVIHATDLEIAQAYAHELFPDETVKLIIS